MANEAKKKFSFKEYFKSVKVEMKKVVWPTKKEVWSYTAVVIATCAVFALGFWLIDTGVLAALKGVLNISLSSFLQVIGTLLIMWEISCRYSRSKKEKRRYENV